MAHTVFLRGTTLATPIHGITPLALVVVVGGVGGVLCGRARLADGGVGGVGGVLGGRARLVDGGVGGVGGVLGGRVRRSEEHTSELQSP